MVSDRSGPCRLPRQHSNRGNRAMTTETTWIRAGHEDVLALVPGLWFPVAEQPGGNIVAFVKTGENRDCIIADHNAALVSPAGVDLALVRSTLESKIKDDRYHPQYILGMAFAHQLLESVTAAGTDALEAKAALLADTLDDVLQWRTIADATQAALDEAVKALAALRQEHETWRDWQREVEAARTNATEAVRQRDETSTRLSESLWRGEALRGSLGG